MNSKRFNLCMALFLIMWLDYAQPGYAQQVSDNEFRYDVVKPSFKEGEGPRVCIDGAHHNFHTVDGRYKPFANLLRQDGYRVSGFDNTFSKESLNHCDLLVIANALGEENSENWNYPHYTAFTGEEIQEVMQWVRSGGNLLIIADHAPIAAAARELGAVLGLAMIDIYAFNDGTGGGNEVFTIEDETLHAHPITKGLSEQESITEIRTFTGQAALLTQHWQPLLTFGKGAIGYFAPFQIYQQLADDERPPFFSVAGMSQGAAREWEKGRIVFLGEAAMCSAQVSGPQRRPMGMNSPAAKQNPLFCLNTVRWLTHVID